MWCSRPWVGRLIWISTLLVVSYIAWGSVHFPEGLWAPGHLSRAHSNITRCLSCHQPFVGPIVEKCVVCHTKERFQKGNQSDISALHLEILGKLGTCLQCHTEHQGLLSSITLDVRLAQNPHGKFIYQVTRTSTCADCHHMNPPPTIQASGLLQNGAVRSLIEEGDGMHRSGYFAECGQCHGRGSLDDHDIDDRQEGGEDDESTI